LSVPSLKQGTNTLAVEVHQAPAGGHDCSFDLELVGELPLTPPVVTILSPTNGSVLNLGDLVIETAASDFDGHVREVNFFTNGFLMGVSRADPFSFLWEDPPPGRYALTAQVLVNTGFAAYSQRVNLQIGNLNPPVTVIRTPYLQSGSSTSIVVRW